MIFKILCLAFFIALATAQVGLEEIEEYEGAYDPIPYSFGYSIDDVHGKQHRHEQGDGTGRVTGSYGFVDEYGIQRIVQYIADHLGFRAKIITNEPGTANVSPAGVIMESSQR